MARKWKGKPSLDELYKLTYKLVKDNPYLFIKGRVLMFNELVFPTKHLHTFNDNYGEFIDLWRDIPLANDMQFYKVPKLLG